MASSADDRGGWSPSLRYPDPLVRSLDKRFDKYRLPLASVERLYTGARWGEGPVWFGDGRYLSGATCRATACGGGTRKPARSASSASPPTTATAIRATARAGSSPASICARRVTRTEYDGSITVICDRFEGKRLNSPNDVVVKSDGSIWFTDPQFGILGYYEGDNRRAGTADERLSRRRRDRRGHAWSPTASTRRTGSPSRPTKRNSTSSSRAASRASS